MHQLRHLEDVVDRKCAESYMVPAATNATRMIPDVPAASISLDPPHTPTSHGEASGANVNTVVVKDSRCPPGQWALLFLVSRVD